MSNPNMMTSFGISVFEGCSLLQTIPLQSITRIPERAFFGCQSLLEIKGNFYAEKFAFTGCEKLKILELKGSGNFGERLCSGCISVETVVLNSNSESDSTLSERAFFGCSKLTNVEANVNSIGNFAFTDCTSLNVITNKLPTKIGNRSFVKDVLPAVY